MSHLEMSEDNVILYYLRYNPILSGAVEPGIVR